MSYWQELESYFHSPDFTQLYFTSCVIIENDFQVVVEFEFYERDDQSYSGRDIISSEYLSLTHFKGTVTFKRYKTIGFIQESFDTDIEEKMHVGLDKVPEEVREEFEERFLNYDMDKNTAKTLIAEPEYYGVEADDYIVQYARRFLKK